MPQSDFFLPQLHALLDQLRDPTVLTSNGATHLQAAVLKALLARGDAVRISDAEIEAMVTSMDLRLRDKLGDEEAKAVAEKLADAFLNVQAFYESSGFRYPGQAAAALMRTFKLDA